MPRPKGIKETKPRKPRPRKITEPGLASWKRLWAGGHYQSKGLSFELFREIASKNCYYCGDPPRLINAYGRTYDHHRSMYSSPKKQCSYEWWNEQWIYANGVDKMTHQEDYLDTSNLVPCCTTCNFLKQRLPHDDFLKKIEQIYFHRIKND